MSQRSAIDRHIRARRWRAALLTLAAAAVLAARAVLVAIAAGHGQPGGPA